MIVHTQLPVNFRNEENRPSRWRVRTSIFSGPNEILHTSKFHTCNEM